MALSSLSPWAERPFAVSPAVSLQSYLHAPPSLGMCWRSPPNVKFTPPKNVCHRAARQEISAALPSRKQRISSVIIYFQAVARICVWISKTAVLLSLLPIFRKCDHVLLIVRVYAEGYGRLRSHDHFIVYERMFHVEHFHLLIVLRRARSPLVPRVEKSTYSDCVGCATAVDFGRGNISRRQKERGRLICPRSYCCYCRAIFGR